MLANMGSNSTGFTEFPLRFVAPPVLNPSQTSTDMVVKEGDTVELQCSALGLPNPTIQWERQGNALLPIGQEIFFVSPRVLQ